MVWRAGAESLIPRQQRNLTGNKKSSTNTLASTTMHSVFRSFLISFQYLLPLYFPIKLVSNPLPACLPQLLPKRIRIQELDDLLSEICRIIRASIECSIACGAATFRKVKEHHWPSVGHVFQHFIHGGLIIHRILWIGRHTDVGGGKVCGHFFIQNSSREVNQGTESFFYR